jgi:ATP-dependent Clp protease ATP-binding subunit ClpC
MWTGIPVFKLTEAETQKLMRMEEELHKRVIGQGAAVEVISKAIRRSRAPASGPQARPARSCSACPASARRSWRTLAEFLFGDEDSMVRIDTAEYMEKHVSRLVGSLRLHRLRRGRPADRGRGRKPYCVVARRDREGPPRRLQHPVADLEDGRLTDSQGRTVDFVTRS